jgi:hypothetical protein
VKVSGRKVGGAAIASASVLKAVTMVHRMGENSKSATPHARMVKPILV